MDSQNGTKFPSRVARSRLKNHVSLVKHHEIVYLSQNLILVVYMRAFLAVGM
jgi:hypothetical protein